MFRAMSVGWVGVSVVLVTLGAVHIHKKHGQGSYSAPRGYLRDVGEGLAGSARTWMCDTKCGGKNNYSGRLLYYFVPWQVPILFQMCHPEWRHVSFKGGMLASGTELCRIWDCLNGLGRKGGKSKPAACRTLRDVDID